MKIHCLLRIRVKVFINCSRYESDSLMFHFVDFKSILYLLSYCPCLIVLVLATQSFTGLWFFIYAWNNSLQMKVTLYNEYFMPVIHWSIHLSIDFFISTWLCVIKHYLTILWHAPVQHQCAPVQHRCTGALHRCTT